MLLVMMYVGLLMYFGNVLVWYCWCDIYYLESGNFDGEECVILYLMIEFLRFEIFRFFIKLFIFKNILLFIFKINLVWL